MTRPVIQGPPAHAWQLPHKSFHAFYNHRTLGEKRYILDPRPTTGSPYCSVESICPRHVSQGLLDFSFLIRLGVRSVLFGEHHGLLSRRMTPLGVDAFFRFSCITRLSMY